MDGITQRPADVALLPPVNRALGAEVDCSVVDRRPYLICHGVHLAFADDCTVMLHRGLYKSFGIPEERALALGVQAWRRSGSEGALNARQSEFLKGLATQGVLTQDSRFGAPASAVSIESPVRSLLDHDLDWSRPAITGPHIRRFYMAMIMGRIRQVRCPLELLAQWVKVRRARAQTICREAHADLYLLVHIFRRLRPLIFAGRDRCVLDSLGLIEFLAANGADISGLRWVVGVRARPWAAHCWFQQQEGLVVNDTCERVRQYVPILIA